MRLSCLQHGVTVHTQFDLVSPFPRFEPKVSLKRDNCVVVNTLCSGLSSFVLSKSSLRSLDSFLASLARRVLGGKACPNICIFKY